MIAIIYLVQFFGLIDFRKIFCFRHCLGKPPQNISSKASESDNNSAADSTNPDNLDSFREYGLEPGPDKSENRLRNFPDTDSASEFNDSFARPLKSELQQVDIFPRIPPRQPMAIDLSQGSENSLNVHLPQYAPKASLSDHSDAGSDDDILNLPTLARKKSLLPDKSRFIPDETNDLHGSLYSPTAESDYKSTRTESTASGDYQDTHPLRDAMLERLDEEGGEDADSDVFVLSKMHLHRGGQQVERSPPSGPDQERVGQHLPISAFMSSNLGGGKNASPTTQSIKHLKNVIESQGKLGFTLNESVQTDYDEEFDEPVDFKTDKNQIPENEPRNIPKTHDLNLRIIRAQLSKMKDVIPPDRAKSSPRTVEFRSSQPPERNIHRQPSDLPPNPMASSNVRRNRTTSPRAVPLLSDQMHALYWAATSTTGDSRPGTHRLITPRLSPPLTVSDSDSRRSQTPSRADMLAALASRVITPRSGQNSARGPGASQQLPSLNGLETMTPRSGSMHWSQIAEENQRSQRSEKSSMDVFIQSQMSRQRATAPVT